MTRLSDEDLLALRDRHEIENILGLYCRGVDRLDVPLLKSIYHADAVNERGGFSGTAQEFAEAVVENLRAACVATWHTVTHSVIDIRGDEAFAESYYQALHIVAGGAESLEGFFGQSYAKAQAARRASDADQEFIAGGRYIDRLERRAGRWAISNREITVEWMQYQPTASLEEGVPKMVYRPGRRDKDDAVYR